MSEFNKAFVVGGWSEGYRFLEGLTRCVSEGPNRLVAEAESVTLGYALREADKFNKEAARRLVIGHSAAFMAINRAGLAVSLNGAEPTPLPKTIFGGLRVGTNKIGKEEAIVPPKLTDGFMEIAMSPRTMLVPFWLRQFSTLNKLINNAEAYPGGRVYLPADKDEFGFGSNGEVDRARACGIVSWRVQGWHNQPLLYPSQSVAQIHEALNRLDEAVL